MTHATQNWSVADAKARFSELIELARREGPQTITKNGRSTAVLVSVEEWERKTNGPARSRTSCSIPRCEAPISTLSGRRTTRARSTCELPDRHERDFGNHQTKTRSTKSSVLHETDEDRLFVSVITLGELRRGVALKADGRAKSALDTWLRRRLTRKIRRPHRRRHRASRRHVGEPDGGGQATRNDVARHGRADSFAATALVHGKTLVTRNIKDFAPFEVSPLDPWEPIAKTK